MSKNQYIDDVLLRIRRKYTKDEEMKLVFQEFAKCRIERGKLTSHIQELEAEIVKMRKTIKKYGRMTKEQQLDEANRKSRKEIKVLKQDIERLAGQLYSAHRKVNKLERIQQLQKT